MAFPPRPTRADIDLIALIHNLQQVRNCCSGGQGVLVVVKADAYGHGAVQVSRALEKEGVEMLGVATAEEGIALREAGIKKPVLVFGGCYPGQEAMFVTQQLTAVVFSLQDLKRLDAYGTDHNLRFPVHLKCDTGMGRVGFLPREIPELIEVLTSGRGIEIAGLMSHLACADEPDSPLTQNQIACFRDILQRLESAGVRPPAIHLCNSAGLAAWRVPECTLVRPGIMLYGSYPAPEFREKLDLRPVMTLSTEIALLRSIDAEQGVSYGHIYTTRRETLLATLPVGYADGYNRLLSNCGEVLIRGQKAPVVGRVCMDWIMVDVTDIPGVTRGDRVVLLGYDGELQISVEDWASKVDSISYEVFCGISQRVPRYFHASGFRN